MNIINYVVVLGLVWGAVSGLHAADKDQHTPSNLSARPIYSVVSIQSLTNPGKLSLVLVEGKQPVSKVIELFKKADGISTDTKIALYSYEGNFLSPDHMLGYDQITAAVTSQVGTGIIKFLRPQVIDEQQSKEPIEQNFWEKLLLEKVALLSLAEKNSKKE